MLRGKVVTTKVSAGYCFIEESGGSHIFAHASQFPGRRLPAIGEVFEFEILDVRGKPQCVNLVPVVEPCEPTNEVAVITQGAEGNTGGGSLRCWSVVRPT